MAGRRCRACLVSIGGSTDGHRASIFALVKAGRVDTDVIVALVKSPDDINIVDEGGSAPIHILARRTKWNTLMELLHALDEKHINVDVDLPDPTKKNETILHSIASFIPSATKRDQEQYIQWIALLCKLSKRVGRAGEHQGTPMHYAVTANNPIALYAFARYNTYKMEDVLDVGFYMYGITRGQNVSELLYKMQYSPAAFLPFVRRMEKALADGENDACDDRYEEKKM